VGNSDLPGFSEPPSTRLSKSHTIVVAEDDRLTRELLAGMLRSHGYLVEAFADGQAAVERVGQGGIDLVLLDILMPRLSGLEACRLLKSMTADSFLPVVLVTVKTDSASRVEGLKIGADDYVCKRCCE
jgi:DNA-binding response OmpR family regulator